MQTVPFHTRARTIDHLGREQIADCPTAVSELWKNAFDAYAKEVSLHVFDGDSEVAAIMDDGHGMNSHEFISKWLVVGTESKMSGGLTPAEDRNGLPVRPKQGQKGIGRLSCAALGSLLLLISKRRDAPFVASMIDWRIFENPYLMLQDIRIPVVEFNSSEELFQYIPELRERLLGNLDGEGDDLQRDQRIREAWDGFDSLELRERSKNLDWLLANETDWSTTRERVKRATLHTSFCERHLSQWAVWSGQSAHGTALLLGYIAFDLKAQLPLESEDQSEVRARDKLFETLSSFSDPFVNSDDIAKGYGAGEFACSVLAWNGSFCRVLVDKSREFDLSKLDALEHILDGEVDEAGVFRGRVKSYGRWLDGQIEIRPAIDPPRRTDTRVGPFRLRAGSWTDKVEASTLTKDQLTLFQGQAALYAGFMVYRDGLRVMPYGREDNDFFEIEKRRSKHAGRYFWANRRTFGRVAISGTRNPNLKDKAGREGIIDNRASKAFRELVENILIASGQRYFGTDSDMRADVQPELQARNAAARAEEDREQLRKKLRKQFRRNLEELSEPLSQYVEEAETLLAEVRQSANLEDEMTLLELRGRVYQLSDNQAKFNLGEPPKNLTSAVQDQYREFRSSTKRALSAVVELRQLVSTALEQIRLKEPRQVAYSELNRNASHLHRRIRQWLLEANQLLDSEKKRIRELADGRNKAYHAAMEPRVDDVGFERASLSQVLEEMDTEKERQDRQNAELFEPYIGALRSLQESIDLEGLAAFGMEQVSELREELDRLNALAQLGITVEIIGHEMESLDTTITRSLASLPEEIKTSVAFRTALTAHEALTDRLRFLSPLKLSGERTKELITGERIANYVADFFGRFFEADAIQFEVTSAFMRFRVYDQPARLLPVFLNLVNNARYWVLQKNDSRKLILLDVRDDRVLVADDGPGVDPEDHDRLFTLFFTRKTRGGRGVGLYLCKANLAAGGHGIVHIREPKEQILPGANFAIHFRGAEYE